MDAGRDDAELHPLGGEAGDDRDQVAAQVGLLHDHRVFVGEHARRGAELAAAGDDRELLGGDLLADRGGDDRVARPRGSRSPTAPRGSARGFLRAGPETTRSIASSSVGWSISTRPSRTVSSAASLITLASSAPLKPEVRFGDLVERGVRRQRPLAAVQAEDFEPAVDVGDVDRRPGGRSGPAAAAPGRGRRGGWSAASTTRPASPPKPSISTSSAFSVCSRSSLPWPTPAPRLRPAASSSSMKISAGAILRALREEVADAGGADADQRLDEVRARRARRRRRRPRRRSPWRAASCRFPAGRRGARPSARAAPTVAYLPGSAR